MEVIVLAGGMGTRLRTVVADVPKPMAPVKGLPFLEYVLSWLSKYPVTQITLSVGYKAEVISNYFGNVFRGIPLRYVVEDQPLGTGGAIKYSVNGSDASVILIVNADTYFPIDINKFLEFHKQGKAKLSIALKQMENFDRYGTVELDHDTISRFNEKKFCSLGLINGGVYLMDISCIEIMPPVDAFSFEKEVLEKQAGTSTLNGMIFDEPFIDIGVPEDYYRAGEMV